MSLGFTISDGRKGTFLDTSKVGSLMAKRTEAGLKRFGAFVRRTSRSSIKDGKNKGLVAKPGSPPIGHTRALRKSIQFALDKKANSVVIGPVPYRDGKGAAALEYGGVRMAIKDGKATLFHYQPRPFMIPAFEAELKKAAEGWQEGGKP